MIDDWRHAAPFGVLGRAVDRVLLGRLLKPSCHSATLPSRRFGIQLPIR